MIYIRCDSTHIIYPSSCLGISHTCFTRWWSTPIGTGCTYWKLHSNNFNLCLLISIFFTHLIDSLPHICCTTSYFNPSLRIEGPSMTLAPVIMLNFCIIDILNERNQIFYKDTEFSYIYHALNNSPCYKLRTYYFKFGYNGLFLKSVVMSLHYPFSFNRRKYLPLMCISFYIFCIFHSNIQYRTKQGSKSIHLRYNPFYNPCIDSNF